ncbi:MAG: mannose-6-phosphate isomerase, partial [Erysipelotrichaceae bacterium]|nr:mannose-6-phosphate isomerase [Erysipelotrichaceae bacterium]
DLTITDCLNKVPVKKGDVFLVKAGTIHAIGEGCLIVEIQERSNVTYRVYDYGSRDKAGNLRPLHIKKAFDVANLQPSAISSVPEAVIKDDEQATVTLLEGCEYFHTYAYDVRKQVGFKVDDTSFCCLTMVRGNGTVSCGDEETELAQGQSLFIPADSGQVTIKGECEALAAFL